MDTPAISTPSFTPVAIPLTPVAIAGGIILGAATLAGCKLWCEYNRALSQGAQAQEIPPGERIPSFSKHIFDGLKDMFKATPLAQRVALAASGAMFFTVIIGGQISLSSSNPLFLLDLRERVAFASVILFSLTLGIMSIQRRSDVKQIEKLEDLTERIRAGKLVVPSDEATQALATALTATNSKDDRVRSWRMELVAALIEKGLAIPQENNEAVFHLVQQTMNRQDPKDLQNVCNLLKVLVKHKYEPAYPLALKAASQAVQSKEQAVLESGLYMLGLLMNRNHTLAYASATEVCLQADPGMKAEYPRHFLLLLQSLVDGGHTRIYELARTMAVHSAQEPALLRQTLFLFSALARQGLLNEPVHRQHAKAAVESGLKSTDQEVRVKAERLKALYMRIPRSLEASKTPPLELALEQIEQLVEHLGQQGNPVPPGINAQQMKEVLERTIARARYRTGEGSEPQLPELFLTPSQAEYLKTQSIRMAPTQASEADAQFYLQRLEEVWERNPALSPAKHRVAKQLERALLLHAALHPFQTNERRKLALTRDQREYLEQVLKEPEAGTATTQTSAPAAGDASPAELFSFQPEQIDNLLQHLERVGNSPGPSVAEDITPADVQQMKEALEHARRQQLGEEGEGIGIQSPPPPLTPAHRAYLEQVLKEPEAEGATPQAPASTAPSPYFLSRPHARRLLEAIQQVLRDDDQPTPSPASATSLSGEDALTLQSLATALETELEKSYPEPMPQVHFSISHPLIESLVDSSMAAPQPAASATPPQQAIKMTRAQVLQQLNQTLADSSISPETREKAEKMKATLEKRGQQQKRQSAQ